MTIGGFNPFSRFHQILNTILLFSLRRDTIDTSTSSLSILSISDSGCLWQTKRTHTRKTHMLNLHMLNLHMLPSVPLVPLVFHPTATRHATKAQRPSPRSSPLVRSPVLRPRHKGPVARRNGYTEKASCKGLAPPVQRAATMGIMMYLRMLRKPLDLEVKLEEEEEEECSAGSGLHERKK